MGTSLNNPSDTTLKYSLSFKCSIQYEYKIIDSYELANCNKEIIKINKEIKERISVFESLKEQDNNVRERIISINTIKKDINKEIAKLEESNKLMKILRKEIDTIELDVYTKLNGMVAARQEIKEMLSRLSY